MSESRVAPALLHWDESGQPLSATYNDVYFSSSDGLAETRYTFLDQNQLRQRFSELSDQQSFAIGETGFGTGLNFLATWALWRETAPEQATLHFVSVEKHPLVADDLRRALGLWPDLAVLSEALLEQYPGFLSEGFHHFLFARGRVRLTLIIDDACRGLDALLESGHPLFRSPVRAMDAWFLDGFAPAKNPQMWSEALFAQLQLLSREGTSFATFTAAGAVRRGLEKAGFSVTRVPGFGRKREMLRGELGTPGELPEANAMPASNRNSDHPLPWNVFSWQPPERRHAILIGAGIGGCHLARALAQRGWRVQLLEQHSELAAEASGNPQGAVYARLSHRRETLSEFNLLALQFALRYYRPFWRGRDSGDVHRGADCGLLQLATDERSAEQHALLLDALGDQRLVQGVSATEARALANLELKHGGLYFPDSGWLNPRALCQWLVNHPAIEILFDHKLTGIDYLQSTRTSGSWQLRTEAGSQLHTPVAVFCNANAVRNFPVTSALPVKPVRGQISLLPTSARSEALATVVCGDGYLTPAIDGHHCVGASFVPGSEDTRLTAEEHRQNLALITELVAANSLAQEIPDGRASARCTSPDYLPLVGPAPDLHGYLHTFAPLRHNSRCHIPVAGPVYPGLFLNLGFGSRGLAYTPICAQMLAARLSGETSPVGRNMEMALHPGRFWIRDLKRRKI